MKLEVDLDGDAMPVDGELTGRVRVVEGGAAEPLTLSVVLYEKSPSYEVAALGVSTVLTVSKLDAGHVEDFTVRLPDGAVPSVKSKHGELFWQVEVRADKPGIDALAKRSLSVV